MAVLGVTWGCGELPPQATLDEGAQARVQKAREAQERFLAKQEAKHKANQKANQPSATKKRKKSSMATSETAVPSR